MNSLHTLSLLTHFLFLYCSERTALSKLEGRQRDLQQSLEALETDTMTITNTKDRYRACLFVKSYNCVI